jgi:hypothetical protein
MSCFETCPRQYEARYVTKEVRFEQGVEATWGDEVHKALEARVRDGTPLPSNVAMYDKWAAAVAARPGEKIVEGAYAITHDVTPCDFFADGVWLRAKIDVLILRDDVAEIIDYKTGKMKNDVTQLRRYALLVMATYPEVARVRAGYAWLKNDVLSSPVMYSRSQVDDIVRLERGVYDRIEAAYMTGKFQPKPSGLCNGWCPVTNCEFWKPKRSY